MLEVIEKVYHYFSYEGDERTVDLPMMQFWYPLVLTPLYLFVVLVLGPRHMQNRKPYNLKTLVQIYNVTQIILNFYIFYEALSIWSDPRSWFRCRPVPPINDPNAMRIIHAHHLYYILKYVEWIDTLVFVARSKQQQVSFLHVYHHGIMPALVWLSVRYAPASSVTFLGFLNSLVHVVMYAYYSLAALGPQMQPYLTWKRYLTSMQIVQFVVILLHYLIAFYDESCNVPRFAYIVCFTFMPTFITLFSLFYIREYNQKKGKKQKEDMTTESRNLKVQ